MFERIGSFFGGVSSFLGGLSGLLPVVSAGAQFLAGREAQKSSVADASEMIRIAEREANESLIAGHIEAKRLVASGRKEIGMAIARSGAAGLQLRGSVLDSISNSYANLKMDELNTRYNAYRDASLLVEKANATARVMVAEGKATLTRSVGNAATTIANSDIFSSSGGI
jgi:hypothetical protein